MELFEFLMILLSIIVGLGLAEILVGYAGLMRQTEPAKVSWLHAAVGAVIFLALLQSFWESWGLRSIEAWSYPAMLMMLAGPVFLFVLAHILFPATNSSLNLEEHYFAHSRQIWTIGIIAALVSVLFRPVAFGMPLFIVDNVSVLPMLLIFGVLLITQKPIVHRVLVPLVLIAVILDTLTINYLIS